ncbi:hypothetical protein HNQ93_001735 [Hymenobacter luteus]|uniref:Uncharacterized protein n=2 Tax=Hymenobacter TaxID=89966 RepID=A0A7W9T151_9BACT|nr:MULTISPECIES: hypothetical protein [Hymenobacter]MBB4600904.1 hypothetical protein [Hymenobacter latericoloratus]MBB6058889.1 hypothetical protein [Hymenobacter luteus]
MRLLVTLAFAAISYVAQAQSWIPPVQVPYIPVQKARPFTSADAQRIRAEVDAELRQQTAMCSEHTKNIYATFNAYPPTINDGWHTITSTDELTWCRENTVYVLNSRITRLYDGVNEFSVEAASLIDKGRAVAKVNGRMLQCYFLNAILDPTSHSEEPKSGSVNFYTNYTKLRGPIDVYVDGQWWGKLDRYFASGTPECGQDATVKVLLPPGLHTYQASCDKLTWNGTIEVRAGECLPFVLREK